ncbi:2-alkenal reductase [Burkholderia contaminans]|uniref:S1 family peptidase n=1 Tax=Burkholderia contaminans TaxID=488447 RepID=UPI001453EE10|nr:serine protease [Burkholderia contaminans]VWD46794.1 2-alkenal reductase [Burkholderia contaminans]
MTPADRRVSAGVAIVALGSLCNVSLALGAASDLGPLIYANEAPAVVLIRAAGVKSDDSVVSETGTGFLINDSGYVLTASHVVPDDADLKNLVVSGVLGPNTATQSQTYQLKLVKRSDTFDVALLRMIPPPHGVAFLPLRSTNATPGEQLFVLGYPLGLPDTHFVDGRVSSVDASDITTNALVNKGNSGGPVVDGNGCVVGVVYSGIETTHDGDPVTGVKFAVPVVSIKSLLPAGVSTSFPASGMAGGAGAIHVTDVLSRTQTDHPNLFGDYTRQYHDVIFARTGYLIDSVESVVKNSLNPPQLTFPDPQISADRKSMNFTYSLISGPITDQRRGWIEMTINTRQVLQDKSQSASLQPCQ